MNILKSILREVFKRVFNPFEAVLLIALYVWSDMGILSLVSLFLCAVAIMSISAFIEGWLKKP